MSYVTKASETDEYVIVYLVKPTDETRAATKPWAKHM